MKTRPLWLLPNAKMPVELKNFDNEEMEHWAEGIGISAYRGRQIQSWLFKRLACSFEDMTDLPKSLRLFLARETNINHLSLIKNLISEDGTRKYLFELLDGHRIESVLIPERDHLTLCISSQAGCAMGCRFCLTGKQGLKRNLSTAEILDQVIQVKRSIAARDRLTNIVFMGMGEPLANYRNVTKAAKILISETGLNFSHRKVTLSTSGLIPEMIRLGKDVIVNLAVSLNAADDETRSFLMPINNRFGIQELMDTCRFFPLPNRRMITFEYILIDGVNDSIRDASKLSRLLSGLKAKINLIPLNSYEGSDFSPPPMDRILEFQARLVESHFTAIIRKSKGEDILAACGQLSGTGVGS